MNPAAQGPRVAIVGGGITGLAAAYELSRHAARLDWPRWWLFERSPRLGGVVHTERAEGFLLDAGPDSFVARKSGLRELIGELGLSGQIVTTRPEAGGAYVWWDGRLHPLPMGLVLMVPGDLRSVLRSSLLSWRGRLRLLADLALPPRRAGGEESLASFVRRRLGQEVLERIAEPLVAGIHAADPRTMSVQASFPRFPEMERRYGSLLRAAMAQRRQARGGGGGSQGGGYFLSLQEGMGQLVRALLGILPADALQPGVEVTALERAGAEAGARPRRYRLAWAAPGAGGAAAAQGVQGTLEVDAVILATPADAAARLLRAVQPDAAAVVSEIGQVTATTVFLAYRKADLPAPLQGSGFLVPAATGRPIMGVTYVSRKWPGRVPGEEYELFRVFVGGPSQPELASAEPARVAAVARQELADLLGIRAQPVLERVYRWPRAMHQYTLGHLERLRRLEDLLPPSSGLYLAGSAYRGIGLGDCVESGRAAARAALAYLEEGLERRPTVPGAVKP